MGIWSSSAFGNDTSKDLLSEFEIAFSQFSPQIAIAKLDEYVQKSFGKDEWNLYLISVAVFIHRHGIKLDFVIDRAISLINNSSNDFTDPDDQIFFNNGLKKIEKELIQDMPSPKAVKSKLNNLPVFSLGDVLTLEIQMDNNSKADTKYILLQKVGDLISWQSSICPTMKDIWPIFQLYSYINKVPPTINDYHRAKKTTVFFSNGKMHPYKQRNVRIICTDFVKAPLTNCDNYIFFNKHMDSYIIDMLRR